MVGLWRLLGLLRVQLRRRLPLLLALPWRHEDYQEGVESGGEEAEEGRKGAEREGLMVRWMDGWMTLDFAKSWLFDILHKCSDSLDAYILLGSTFVA